MDVIVADVTEHDVLKGRRVQRGMIQADDFFQLGVGHGHIRAQLRQARLFFPPLVDHQIHGLRDGVPEIVEPLHLALVHRGPRGALVAAALDHDVGERGHRLGKNVLVVAVKLDVNARMKRRRQVRNIDEDVIFIFLVAEQIQGAAVDEFDRGGHRPDDGRLQFHDVAAEQAHEDQRVALGLEERHHAPLERRRS